MALTTETAYDRLVSILHQFEEKNNIRFSLGKARPFQSRAPLQQAIIGYVGSGLLDNSRMIDMRKRLMELYREPSVKEAFSVFGQSSLPVIHHSTEYVQIKGHELKESHHKLHIFRIGSTDLAEIYSRLEKMRK
ncbi:MAG: hypothetical protein AABX01_07670 [Candidatus Micrarchaeota archaeon]